MGIRKYKPTTPARRGSSVADFVEVVELGSLASITRFARRVGRAPVDILINNAGLSAADPGQRTSDGFDLQIGVNYLGSFALTAQLWPALSAAESARVVTLGSMVAMRGRIEPTFGCSDSSTYRSYSCPVSYTHLDVYKRQRLP